MRACYFRRYVEVDAEAGRSLFYAFVEGDESEKSGLPLVLWLNGGPGCSSLSGFFRELGPFFPSLDGNGLVRNEYAWSQAANMIFLESPACEWQAGVCDGWRWRWR